MVTVIEKFKNSDDEKRKSEFNKQLAKNYYNKKINASNLRKIVEKTE